MISRQTWQSFPLIVVAGLTFMVNVFLFRRAFMAQNPREETNHGDH